jgi:hypothetical protein
MLPYHSIGRTNGRIRRHTGGDGGLGMECLVPMKAKTMKKLERGREANRRMLLSYAWISSHGKGLSLMIVVLTTSRMFSSKNPLSMDSASSGRATV